jgi:hypothetical protein
MVTANQFQAGASTERVIQVHGPATGYHEHMANPVPDQHLGNIISDPNHN